MANKIKISKKPDNHVIHSYNLTFDKIFKEYSKWITFGLVLILLFITFHEFFFGRLYYLFSDIAIDTIINGYPLLYHVTKYIHIEGFPLWSFSQGMGQNIMPSSLGDPFYWIVYLAGTDHTAYAIIWMEITKILITSIVFYHFLKLWNFTSIVKIVGSLLYCFSSFMLVGGQWWVFSTEACYLAILLLGFEYLYRRNTWYIFSLAIALFAMLNPVRLYIYCIYLFIYLSYRHLSSAEPTFKKFLTIVLKMSWFGLFGLILSSFIFIADCQQLIDSPRGSGNFSYFRTLFSIPFFSFERQEHYVTAIYRFFSSDLLGNGVNFSGWHNYLEAPLFYIGLLPLLLIPQVFVMHNKKFKLVHAILLIVIIIPTIFPFVRYALFLFSGDYYRSYSLFVSVSFLLVSLLILDNFDRDRINSINIYVSIGTLVALILILYYPYPIEISNINIADGSKYTFRQNVTGIISINTEMRLVICIFLVLYTILILLFKFERIRPYLRILLIFILSLEIYYMNSGILMSRQAISPENMSHFYNLNKDVVDYLNATDKEFYRIDKNYYSAPIELLLNNAKVEGYYGTSSYDSFNQKYYIRFLEEMGIIENGSESQTRFSNGLLTQPLLWPFASIKYYIGLDTDYPHMKAFGYEPIKRQMNSVVYKNNHFLPLGYTYDHFISISEFRKLTELQKELTIYKAFVAEEPIASELKRKLKEYDIKDIPQNNTIGSYIMDIDLLRKDTFKIDNFSQNNISGTIKLDTPKLLFFSIPYDKGWKCFIDNIQIKPLLTNVGFIGFLLDPGRHNIKLYYKPPYFIASLCASLIGLAIYLGLILIHFINKRKNNKVL
jgi:hypothetical protein